MEETVDWTEIKTYLERNLEVYHLKRNPEENERRDREHAQAIAWTVEQMKEGPMPGGTNMDITREGWTFGSSYWDAVQGAIRLRDPMCRICGVRPTREVHHIRPRFLKGSDHPRNLVGLCFECHDEVHRAIDRGIRQTLEGSLGVTVPIQAVTLDDFSAEALDKAIVKALKDRYPLRYSAQQLAEKVGITLDVLESRAGPLTDSGLVLIHLYSNGDETERSWRLNDERFPG
jgi:hypothetical protein